MTHPNEELVRRAFDTFASGDVETLRGLMDQDSVWHAPGRNPLAGDHRGVEAILGYFAKTMELTGVPSEPSFMMWWPTTSMRSRCLWPEASVRGSPLRPGTCW
jgi:ketosteroid isomerase-like protein